MRNSSKFGFASAFVMGVGLGIRTMTGSVDVMNIFFLVALILYITAFTFHVLEVRRKLKHDLAELEAELDRRRAEFRKVYEDALKEQQK